MSLKYFLLVAFLVVVLVNADLNTDNDAFSRHIKARRNRQHNTRIGFEGVNDDSAVSAIETASLNTGAKCYDSRLTNIINTGIQHYSHDMGSLTKYILDQINRARIGGTWLVHGEMINSQQQGLEWQSVTNGDLFQTYSTHGCYYHDTQTYLIVVRY